MKTKKVPAKDKRDYSYGTFLGVFVDDVKTSYGTKERTVAVFEVTSNIQDETMELQVWLNRYHPDNTTGQFCKKMGFEYDAQYALTEEGLEVMVKDNLDDLEDYLETLLGVRYTFKTLQKDNGYHEINISTLREATAKLKVA